MNETSLSRRPARLGLLAVAVVLPLALAACSSSTGSSSTTTTTTTTAGGSSPASTSTTAAPATSALSCALVPASELGTTLGVTVSGPVSNVEASNTICRYTSTNPSGQFLVQFNSDMTLADFAAVEAIATRTEGATTVSGLGDQAYSTTVGSGAFTVSSLQIIKGGKGLLISGPATLTQMEALANQILPQL